MLFGCFFVVGLGLVGFKLLVWVRLVWCFGVVVWWLWCLWFADVAVWCDVVNSVVLDLLSLLLCLLRFRCLLIVALDDFWCWIVCLVYWCYCVLCCFGVYLLFCLMYLLFGCYLVLVRCCLLALIALRFEIGFCD